MSRTPQPFRQLAVWLLIFVGLLVVAQEIPAMFAAPAGTSDAKSAKTGPAADTSSSARDAARNEAAKKAEVALSADDAPSDQAKTPDINYLDLVQSGGVEMAAIILVSILSLAFAIERFLALQRSKVVPQRLIDGLGRLAAQKGSLDLTQADKLCAQFPSTAATVVKTVLLKAGRPAAELEHALSEVNEREASRLYTNIRWQNLAFNVAPMLGLLGTIQGMIAAFYVTSYLQHDKAGHLAAGIYRALVNTFAGLAVAIPAAIFAHLLEGRIMKLMSELDDFARSLLPQLQQRDNGKKE